LTQSFVSRGHFGLGFGFFTEVNLASMFALVAREPAADLILSFFSIFSMASPDLVDAFDPLNPYQRFAHVCFCSFLVRLASRNQRFGQSPRWSPQILSTGQSTTFVPQSKSLLQEGSFFFRICFDVAAEINLASMFWPVAREPAAGLISTFLFMNSPDLAAHFHLCHEMLAIFGRALLQTSGFRFE